MTKLVVFDCDGTLVDSQAMIIAAMTRTFALHGLEALPDERVRRIVGLSLPQAVAALTPDVTVQQHEAMVEDYKQSFMALRAEGYHTREQLYPGIVDVITRLDRIGYLLGVATGKSARGLAVTLGHHGLTDRFVTLQTADHHPSKPHPSMMQQALAEAGAQPADAVLIGDTRYDMEMAANAGTASIGVTWGYHGREELQDAGAGHLVDEAMDLPAVVSRLVGD